MSEKNGGPAFPCVYVKHAPGEVGNSAPIKEHGEGATLRDYFAATVSTDDLIGVRVQADREALVGRPQPEGYPNGLDSLRFCMEVEAALRMLYADAMLKARNE